MRGLVIMNGRRIAAYMDDATARVVTAKFDYIFATPPGSFYPPLLTAHRLERGVAVSLEGPAAPSARRHFGWTTATWTRSAFESTDQAAPWPIRPISTRSRPRASNISKVSICGSSDTHCHLDFPDFAPEQADIVARAQARGVGRMITISTHVTKFAAIAAIAERYEDVFCTVGTHPNHALDEPEASPEQLVALARHPKCVAFGEAGLDYHYNHAPKDTAARVFRNHIAAARMAGLPLVIHTRDADEDCAKILREEMGQGAFTALLHCFTASQALADTAVELGLYISFSGVVTFKNSQALRDVAASLPLERMLVETDAPFLAPTPHRGKRNEPAFVAETAAVLARLKGLSDADFAAATTANALRLFSKMPPLREKERAA